MSALTFGLTPALSFTPYIAKEKYFFRERGVDINFREFLTGRKSMQALQKGWIDIGNVIDVNVASLALERKPKIKLLACTQIREDGQILARTDANIKTPQDLIGKKLGYMPYTSSHMFIEYFAQHHNLDSSKIDLTPVKTDQMEKELLCGNIDACSLWQPFSAYTQLSAAQSNIELIRFKNEGFFKFYVVLGVTQKALKQSKGDVDSILSALKQAAEYTESDTEDSHDILAKIMNLPINIFQQLQSDTSLDVIPIPDDFWEQVQQQLAWVAPDKNVNYEKYIDELTSLM